MHKYNSKRNEDKNCLAEFIRSFDFYKDLPDSLSEPTLTGAWMSIILLSIIGTLLFQATYSFLQFDKTSEI